MESSTFLKQLSSNNRTVREKSLGALENFLQTDQFKKAKQIQYNKLWKALYYTMWFSDRPRPQQRLANQLGKLYTVYTDDQETETEEITLNDKAFIKMSKAFWKIMCLEWFNIDRFRLDKYLLLVRRVFFNQLKYLQNRNWNPELVELYINKVLKHSPLSGDKKVYNGIPFHLIDIVLDEWERLVSNRDDEYDNEDEITDEEEITTLVKETPLAQFFEIFVELQKDIINSKGIRNKIKEDLYTDERLTRWGVKEAEVVVEAAEDDEESAEENSDVEKSDGETEWKGF